MNISENDKITTTKVLNATTAEGLLKAILEHSEETIEGSNYVYGRVELAAMAGQWLGGECLHMFPYQPNSLPRTFGIRVKAMELSGKAFPNLNTTPEAFAAYKARVLTDFDYFNVNEIWGD